MASHERLFVYDHTQTTLAYIPLFICICAINVVPQLIFRIDQGADGGHAEGFGESLGVWALPGLLSVVMLVLAGSFYSMRVTIDDAHALHIRFGPLGLLNACRLCGMAGYDVPLHTVSEVRACRTD